MTKLFSRSDAFAVLAIGIIPILLYSFRDQLYGEKQHLVPLKDWPDAASVVYSFGITLILYLGNLRIIRLLQRKLPWSESPLTRLIAEFLLCFFFSTGIQLVVLLILVQVFSLQAGSLTVLLTENILFGNTVTLVVLLVVEGLFFFRQWKNSLVLAADLQREKSEAELLALRQQVQPHVLFNSLNTIAALIRQDPDRAEAFVGAFARFYRYVLDRGEEQWISLAREWEVYREFKTLLEIRFQGSIRWTEEVRRDELNRWLIPPLVLLELVENAVKHNQVMADQPLEVKIALKDNLLTVTNQFRPRLETYSSTGKGWKGIRHRYRLLGMPEPQLTEEDGWMVARAALIAAS